MDQVLELLLYLRQRESRRLHVLRNDCKVSYFARNHFVAIRSFFEFMDKRLEKPEDSLLEPADLLQVRRGARILTFWEDFGELLLQNSDLRGQLRAHLELNLGEFAAVRRDFAAMETDLRALMSIQATGTLLADSLQAKGVDEALFQHRLYTVEDTFKRVKSFRSGRVENYYNRSLERLIRLKSQGRLDEQPAVNGEPLPEPSGLGLNAESAFYFGNLKKFRARVLEGDFGEQLGYVDSKLVLVIFDSHLFLGEAGLVNLLTDVNNLLNQAWLDTEDFPSKLEYIQRCRLFVEDLAFLNSKVLRHVGLLAQLDRQGIFKSPDVASPAPDAQPQPPSRRDLLGKGAFLRAAHSLPLGEGLRAAVGEGRRGAAREPGPLRAQLPQKLPQGAAADPFAGWTDQTSSCATRASCCAAGESWASSSRRWTTSSTWSTTS